MKMIEHEIMEKNKGLSKIFTVSKIITDINPWNKKIFFYDRKPLTIHRNALISKGDSIEELKGKLYILGDKDKFQIKPKFLSKRTKKINSIRLKIHIREIDSEVEWNKYLDLQKYHYLPVSGFPREVTLIASIKEFGKNVYIGYITISLPPLMNKARHEILNRPFTHPLLDINWDKWDMDAIKNNINRIVSISRILIHPEYRSAGLSSILISSAKKYCKSRWHLAGKKPVFIEITAALLLFSPFPCKSGLKYAGNTLGNINRVYQDVKYLLNGKPHIPSGIKAMQNNYLNKFRDKCEKFGFTVEEGLKLLEDVDSDLYYRDNYNFYKDLVRLPKGVYVGGLDEYSIKYINQFKRGDNHNKFINKTNNILNMKQLKIRMNNLSFSYKRNYVLTERVKMIHEIFGDPGKEHDHEILKDFTYEISSGEIVGICGPSGGGKTSILNLIAGKVNSYSGNIQCDNDQILDIRDIKLSDNSIIDDLKGETTEIINVLNNIGLFDALTYVKPYSKLSEGQKFRIKLGHLFISDKKIWIIDEFCTGIDPLTTSIIIKNIKKVVKNRNIILIVATANPSIIKLLSPDKIFWKGLDPELIVFNNSEFTQHFEESLYRIFSEDYE